MLCLENTAAFFGWLFCSLDRQQVEGVVMNDQFRKLLLQVMLAECVVERRRRRGSGGSLQIMELHQLEHEEAERLWDELIEKATTAGISVEELHQVRKEILLKRIQAASPEVLAEMKFDFTQLFIQKQVW